MSAQAKAPSSNVSAASSKIKRLLQCDDEPTAKRMCVASGINIIPVLLDGRHQSTSSQGLSLPSLAGSRGVTANEGSYRLARETTNIRDLWARPKTVSDTDPRQAGTQHTDQCLPAQPGSQPTDRLPTQPRDWQISLRPSTHLASPGPQLTDSARLGTQRGDWRITLQPGSQPAVLSDKSNHPTTSAQGHHDYRKSYATSRATHTGQRASFVYYIYLFPCLIHCVLTTVD